MAKQKRRVGWETMVALAALFSCLFCTNADGWRWPGGMVPEWYFALYVCLFQISGPSGLILIGRWVKRLVLFVSLAVHFFLLGLLASEFQSYLVRTRPPYLPESKDPRVPAGWTYFFG